jgi:hypothetical protein
VAQAGARAHARTGSVPRSVRPGGTAGGLGRTVRPEPVPSSATMVSAPRRSRFPGRRRPARSRPWRVGPSLPRPLSALVVSVVALVLAGCGLAGGGPTFAPDGPCLADGRQPGAYPELEALVPARFDERPPERLDSGRSCSRDNLAGLAAAGITELRFAGGLWPTGAESGVTLAVFTAPGLTVDALGAWYEAGARAARKTSNIVVTHPDLGGGTGYRIDLENGGQLQTIVVHRAAAPDTVRVVLVGSAARDVRTPDAHAAIVERAVAASLAADG